MQATLTAKERRLFNYTDPLVGKCAFIATEDGFLRQYAGGTYKTSMAAILLAIAKYVKGEESQYQAAKLTVSCYQRIIQNRD